MLPVQCPPTDLGQSDHQILGVNRVVEKNAITKRRERSGCSSSVWTPADGERAIWSRLGHHRLAGDPTTGYFSLIDGVDSSPTEHGPVPPNWVNLDS